MKLRNKKTGEIVDLAEGFIRDTYNGSMIQLKPVAISNKQGYIYGSLAELNEEWEDYKEPKDFWYIDDFMIMCGTEGEFTTPDLASFTKKDIEKLKAIGNYFETKEEAEEAVERLRAWKRLKDKGFRFDGIAGMGNEIYFKANEQFTHIMVDEYTCNKTEKEYIDDLTLIFGGEE